MKKLFSKESEVEKKSKKHVELAYKCVTEFKALMDSFYLNQYETVDLKVNKIAKIEQKADVIRREMERDYYKGAFLPFDREDRIILAELVDSVTDVVEETSYEIGLSKIKFPENFKEDFSKLIDCITKSVYVLKECIELLDEDLSLAISKAHEVEEIEEFCDKIERKILKMLYESYRKGNIGVLTLIELKTIVKSIGDIADQAENASDRALIIAAKRRG
ncbi:MAG: TIGR00153 family protein [Methanomicrobiales archaeon]